MSDQRGPRSLRCLQIRNFQTHESTELEFAPGLNVIRGKNSSGKTSVFRAVRLLAYNRPTRGVDDALIRRGKSQLVVKATMSDDSWVIREKGKDVNRYVVSSPLITGGQIELNNFGQSVPPEVSAALGFGPLTLAKTDGIELNIAAQGEGTFMLSETDPEIARWMYALTSLDDVRGAIDSLTVDYKRLGQSLKTRGERVADLERQLLGFEGLDRRDGDLKDVESDADDLTSRMQEIVAMEAVLAEMIELRDRAVPVKERAALMVRVLDVLSDEELSSLEAQSASIDDLREIDAELDRIGPLSQDIEASLRLNAKLCKVDLAKIESSAVELGELTSINTEIDVLQRRMDALSAQLEERRAEEASLTKEYEAAKSELFSSGGGSRCPFCGSEIDSDVVDHMIEEHDGYE